MHHRTRPSQSHLRVRQPTGPRSESQRALLNSPKTQPLKALSLPDCSHSYSYRVTSLPPQFLSLPLCIQPQGPRAVLERLDILFSFIHLCPLNPRHKIRHSKMGGYKSPMTPKRSPKKSPKKTPPKSPKFTFQWNEYRRQVLCCLYRFFELARQDFQRIFSDIFRDHLFERGFPNSQLPYIRLYAQWTWMKGKDHPIWLFVHKETEFNKTGEWKDILSQIRDSARRLRISLTETEKDNDTTDEHETESQILEDIFSTEQAMEFILQSVSSHVRTSVCIIYVSLTLSLTVFLVIPIHRCRQ